MKMDLCCGITALSLKCEFTAKSIIDLVRSHPFVYTETDLNGMIRELTVRRGFNNETENAYKSMIMTNVKSDILCSFY